ncbi:DUF4254 domain-containing protein [Roseateles sp.]|uniref:DUF4254 domain-containing protein n=1 Tax=Roseateles sp. TaxID=1971397 RepID=UPI003265B59A
MPPLLSSADVIAGHDTALVTPPVAVQANDLGGWIAVNHFHNRSLWAQEDLARRTLAADAEIVANKRAIDRHNQARNDAIERIDEVLLSALGLVDAATLANARLNSETAGSMLDRISILGLKIAAMREQTLRGDVDDAHRQACGERLQRLVQQRADLGNCFDELLADSRAGRAYFKVYRQFKMYNDPQLNPALVAESK